ncbi:Cl- channel voltage-gated family protein [Emticicia oligotrophica DSM 17448]|uniref:Cl-channel voltage-gated family protein n=1 Tax=Emticicia oligotrophica (strain DSM 17448 / CIP 109782 / MTCC 6937 / GPTSA100-15) TaxID=929562 RepID=A0ABM5N713_EMTOG|nr:chloride channel protein [Emticicia oligotrophica]AFK05326.1 Cl- channel voltage-gated family protein [Emticicia oligotrophica DSM 17448]
MLKDIREAFRHLFRSILVVFPMAVVTGSLVALFLFLLDKATLFRWQNKWIIYLLPLIGILITQIYQVIGKGSEAGNNLIIDEINEESTKGVPLRMTPLIILTTVLTHLFGGSAGREGTAVQIGGSLAAFSNKIFKFKLIEKRLLVMAGVAAGFSAVFGTPIAATVFALEILFVGRIRFDALLTCLFASIVSNSVCLLYGITHTHYSIASNPLISIHQIDLLFLLKVILAGIAFGIASQIFVTFSELLKNSTKKYIQKKWLIPVIGGGMVLFISFLLNTDDYLGLSVISEKANGISIVSAFKANGVDELSWFWKLILTAITLSMGFKGGEVTPLFFIGAALGNTLGMFLGCPVDLFAGLGFISVFAAATNTPLASMLLGVELFGGEFLPFFAISCIIAYYFSGSKGIYHSQKNEASKWPKI